VPLDALDRVGVNTNYVTRCDYEQTGKLPGIALIPVDREGRNQILVFPGISDDFSPRDIDRAASVFQQAGANQGALILTLECPLPTARHAVEMAKNCGMSVFFDPGGIDADTDVSALLEAGLTLIKPNEHEAAVLTGVQVHDQASARQAAAVLLGRGIDNVVITVGAAGAYVCTADLDLHLPVPEVPPTGQRDETGCGDQTMAVLCTLLQQGVSLPEAARLAIHAGTLQFHRRGIQPLTREDLAALR
jgi:ribokinase